jgi:GNAT superfamily N-acetyltransferase
MADIRDAVIPRDSDIVAGLWLDYLSWGNDGLEQRYGFRLPVEGAVEADLGTIAKFQAPDGRLLVAFEEGAAIGTACMKRIDQDTAEIKRMWVAPPHRGQGIAREMLQQLLTAARENAYRRVRLDSPDFMTAAHALYRACGFAEIDAYPESEIPDEYKRHWIFMERLLA